MEKLWIWYWDNGGYNSAKAASREEAIIKATAMCTLLPNLDSLHEGTYQELARLDRQYGTYFD